MNKKYASNHPLGRKALEMVMRDVLGGMEELSQSECFKNFANVFTIIRIEPPAKAKTVAIESKVSPRRNAEIIQWERIKSAKPRR